MAQPTNTYDSFDSIGNREDLIDVIYDISPTDTPFMSGIARGKATNTLHEWQTDALASPSDNKQIEGDDYAGQAVSPTTRLANYCQIAAKSVVISGTLEAVTRAGRKKEMAYQIAKKAKELKRDMETTLIGTNKGRVAGNSSTARELGSVESWLTTNTSFGATGADPVTIGSTARTDGTQRAFTEDLLTDVLGKCFDAGGDPTVLMVGKFNKGVVSANFTGNATNVHHVNDDKKVINNVEIYVGDFHTLKVVANRYCRPRSAYVLDMSMWAVAYLRPYVTTPLAKTGDNEKRLFLSEYTLVCRNEAASGLVADLTVS